MRDGVSGPQAGLRSIARMSLTLLLAVLLSACAGGPMLPGFQSPQATPTPPASPLETPTAPPKPTWTPSPTRPPTRTPLPTFTPAPPTATPEPLPTLIPGLQTFLYATTGETYPEIYRVQGDQTGRIQGSPYRVNTPNLWRSRIFIQGLFPSPDGTRVAVAWTYGEGGTFVSILDVNNGILTPLFGESAQIDQRVHFLDWSPDGNSVLVLGNVDNPDLRLSAWLVDVNTHIYRGVGIRQRESGAPIITDASFSPNGQEVVYAQYECARCTSEIWRISLEGSSKQLLFQHSTDEIEEVKWSPRGDLIAFVKWQISYPPAFPLGELWVMNTDGSSLRKLSSIVTGPKYELGYGFAPAWSPNGEQIALVSSKATPGNEAYGNIYIVDVGSGSVRQLTQFENVQVRAPIWSPDGLRIAFVTSLSGSPGQFEPQVAAADGSDLHRLDASGSLMLDTRTCNPTIVWLP